MCTAWKGIFSEFWLLCARVTSEAETKPNLQAFSPYFSPKAETLFTAEKLIPVVGPMILNGTKKSPN